MQTKNKTYYKTFGEALKDVLKQRPKPINQSWLGEKSGKGKSEVSLYANDKKMAVEETRKQFGDLLGVVFVVHGNGQWEVKEKGEITTKEDPQNYSPSLDEEDVIPLIRAITESTKEVPLSGKERGLLFRFLKQRLESRSKELHDLSQILQRLSDSEGANEGS